MSKENKSNRKFALALILLALVSLPFIVASLIVLFEPLIVWIFLGIIVFFGLSVEALFDRSESLRSSLPIFLASLMALVSFWYFALR